jgi:hypothetical protein
MSKCKRLCEDIDRGGLGGDQSNVTKSKTRPHNDCLRGFQSNKLGWERQQYKAQWHLQCVSSNFGWDSGSIISISQKNYKYSVFVIICA